MTLALIAIIVFLIVWGCQVSDINAKKKAYRERTKTNASLQIEIRKKAEEEVQSDLREQDIPIGEIFPTILMLYDKYDVVFAPFRFEWMGCKTRDEYISMVTDKCRSSEMFAYKNNAYRNPECHRCIHTTGNCLSCDFNAPVDTSDIMTRIRCSYSGGDDIGYVHGKKRYVSKLEQEYSILVTQVVIKRMHELGYAYSRDNKTESDWQEQEKERKEIDELRKKYPYLFH